MTGLTYIIRRLCLALARCVEGTLGGRRPSVCSAGEGRALRASPLGSRVSRRAETNTRCLPSTLRRSATPSALSNSLAAVKHAVTYGDLATPGAGPRRDTRVAHARTRLRRNKNRSKPQTVAAKSQKKYELPYVPLSSIESKK